MDQEKREKMELTGQILNRDKLVKTLHEKID